MFHRKALDSDSHELHALPPILAAQWGLSSLLHSHRPFPAACLQAHHPCLGRSTAPPKSVVGAAPAMASPPRPPAAWPDEICGRRLTILQRSVCPQKRPRMCEASRTLSPNGRLGALRLAASDFIYLMKCQQHLSLAVREVVLGRTEALLLSTTAYPKKTSPKVAPSTDNGSFGTRSNGRAKSPRRMTF